MGDVFTTVALAGSLFFSISPEAARSKIELYLLLTVAPFGLVAPFLGPLLDRNRSSRRTIIASSLLIRAILMFFMATDIKSLLLFPEAFVVLVASKSYMIAKSALVPDLVDGATPPQTLHRLFKRANSGPAANPALVGVNSELSLLSAIAGFGGGALAAAILKIPHLGAPWVLRSAVIIFLLGVIQLRHLKIKRSARAVPSMRQGEPADEAQERPTHRSPQSVLLAAAAMSVLRGSVGFFTFFIAFNLRRNHAPTYYFGLILAASALGSALATALTPKIRRWLVEETLLISALGLEAALGVIGAAIGSRSIEVAIAATIGFVASSGKLAFDSLVQYNIQPAFQGRAFSRFETRFQLAWVIGGLIPTVVVLPLPAGDLTLAFTAIVAATSFSAGRRAMRMA